MEENYVSFITFEEKNPRKFSIEMDHSNYGFIQPKLEVEKDINFYEEEKPSNNIIQNKTNTYSTNIFQISNIRLDSLGNLTNCEIEVVRPRRYEVLAQEMRTYLMQVHPWKTLYINGKYRPELPIITFPYETKWHKTSSKISTDQ